MQKYLGNELKNSHEVFNYIVLLIHVFMLSQYSHFDDNKYQKSWTIYYIGNKMCVVNHMFPVIIINILGMD